MALMHHGAHDAFPHAIANAFNIFHDFRINAVYSLDKQGAPVVIKQRNQTILHVCDVAQRLQSTA